MDILLRELKNRSIDIVTETGQEDLQELVTIAGTQLGSKIDTGEWAYSFADMVKRLWDTTKESALTFGLTYIPRIAKIEGRYGIVDGQDVKFSSNFDFFLEI